MKLTSILISLSILATGSVMSQQQPANQLRILVFGAHPDDPEKAGGTMAKYIQQGHKVRLVSVTNGDAGHFEMGGGVLAQRRYKEAQCAGAVIGAEYIVLDNHDGELMPTLENRNKIIRIIREFQPDLVFTPRPDDYHPDHRNTALLVRDAAYMVTVPNVVANTPHLRKNPIFIYLSDRFTRPTPFQPDIVVGIDEVVEKKVDMYHCHESQMYEWLPYNRNQLDQVPKTGRREWLGEQLKPQYKREADRYRDKLIELYGQERGSKIVYAEAFEVSEYGSPLRKEDIKKYFPFF